MPAPLRLLDLFSGIGGFSYAAERLVGGFTTVQFVEREPFCQGILRKHWPDVPIHHDICTFAPQPGTADVICGGFPCQDISIAGKQAGIKEGTRSGLFYELMRVVRVVRPRYVILENVSAIVSNGLDTVLGELAAAGYDAEWACIPASAVGACHRRDRWWCVAYRTGRDAGTADALRAPDDGHGSAQEANGKTAKPKERRKPGGSHCVDAANPSGPGLQAAEPARICPDAAESEAGLQPITGGGVADAADTEGKRRQQPTQRTACSGGIAPHPNGERREEQHPPALAARAKQPAWPSAAQRLNPDWRAYVSEPVIRGGDARLSGRVDRLKALGNAVVPQVAAIPLARVLELHQGTIRGAGPA